MSVLMFVNKNVNKSNSNRDEMPWSTLGPAFMY